MNNRFQSCFQCSLVLAVAVAIAPRAFGQSADSDFNNDGYADLAVGVPTENLGLKTDAGCVNIIYGTAMGLSATVNQVWTQDVVGIPGAAANGDGFGSALTSGDFDGDGIQDLAIGIPFKNTSSKADSGAVLVLYGTMAMGLDAAGSQVWTQDSTGITETADAQDHFGASLTSADFDGDGFSDLAIGIPGESVGSVAAAGAVAVLFGSASGLTNAADQYWHQNSTGISEASESGDAFGIALTEGDFDGDDVSDLGVGVPTENVGALVDAGVVHVIYGVLDRGLDAMGSQVWSQNTSGVMDTAEGGDLFGTSLSAARFNNDFRDDLAIGAPGEDVGSKADAGGVNVLYGSGSGLTPSGDQWWTQDVAGIVDAAEAGDSFGTSLADGDFNSDGIEDLAIGAPIETVIGIPATGAVHIILGTAAGLSEVGDKLWHQANAMTDVPEPGDFFGTTVADGDYNGDGASDLAVGVPGEDITGTSNAGAVHIVYGSFGPGLSAVGAQMWSQDSAGVGDACEGNDGFGLALEP